MAELCVSDVWRRTNEDHTGVLRHPLREMESLGNAEWKGALVCFALCQGHSDCCFENEVKEPRA